MDKNFKSIAIYSSIRGKSRSKKVSQIALHIEEVIKGLGLKTLIPNSSNIHGLLSKRTYSDNFICKNADLIIAIGGDGTLLSSARKFGYKGVPVLGINLGNLGFLTDIAPKDLTTSLRDVIEGKFLKDERFFLEARINNQKKSNIALNEVVLHSNSIPQLIEYELFINDHFVYRQKADGIIVSTPTGSTAYSLSANGPIIHPDVKAITLLPMFPHSLNTRPLIIDENADIQIVIGKKGKTSLSLDSHTKFKLKSEDKVSIKRSNSGFNLIHPLNHDFYSACREKLGWSLGIPKKQSIVDIYS